MYDIILADPPWKQSKGGKKSVRANSSGEDLDYQTISLKEIEAIMIEIKSLAKTQHCLFLWTIDKYLFEAEQMALNMGYKLHARMIWNKVTGIPAAFTIRYGHEYLLWFYIGGLSPVALDQRGKIHSVFTEQVKKHSQKPEISFHIIEKLYPDTERIEVFARENRVGWDAFGNQVTNSILLPSDFDIL